MENQSAFRIGRHYVQLDQNCAARDEWTTVFVSTTVLVLTPVVKLQPASDHKCRAGFVHMYVCRPACHTATASENMSSKCRVKL